MSAASTRISAARWTGPNPAPAADYRRAGGGAAGFQRDRHRPQPGRRRRAVPFCERTTRGAGQGAMILKLTRDSVVKAVSHGLDPAEIAGRLRRHASNEVPANVLREVQDWSSWVRQANPLDADRAAMPRPRHGRPRRVGPQTPGRGRVNDTLVAIDQTKLTAADRNKLRAHGIIVQGDTSAGAVRTKGADEGEAVVVTPAAASGCRAS